MQEADLDRFRTHMAQHFCQTHGRRRQLVSQTQLESDRPPVLA